MPRRRQQNPSDLLISNARDYAVPIIIVLIILFLGIKLISWDNSEASWDDSQEVVQNDTQKLSFDLWADTRWEIEYPGWDKDNLTEKVDDWLYPGEKLIVEAWDVTLQDQGWLLMKLDANGELSYESNWWFLLTSSNLFIRNPETMSFATRFFSIVLPENSVVSLNQNEVASAIYVLQWNPEVTTFANKSITLNPWEKLSVASTESSDENYDIEASREEIDNYFFSETWAQSNNLESYLTSAEETQTVTNSSESTISTSENTISTGTGETTTTSSSSDLITINWIEDGQTYSTPELEISGTITDDRVARVQFGNVLADMNLVAKTYLVAGFSIPLKVNDVVYKVFDAQNNVLKRWVFTVYNSAWGEATVVDAGGTTTPVWSESFPVADANPNFRFTAPTANPYTTQPDEDFVTIRGAVTPGSAASVTVNGRQLNSFDGSSWRFHATSSFDTMQPGVNLYKVNYFDNAGTVVHTDTFTIIKK